MIRFKLARLIVALVPLICAALLTGLVLAFVTHTPSIALAAPTNGVVGTGTAASCSEAALNTALGGGGPVTFNCGAAPHTITLTGYKTIAANTTIDGGGKITLSGGGATKIFWVNAGYRLTLNNIIISDGSSAIGGCITVATGTLNASNTTIQNCAGHTTILFSGTGGAIYAFNATLALTDTSILNNSTDVNGGGLYQWGGHATLNNVSVLNNTADFTDNGSGGGL